MRARESDAVRAKRQEIACWKLEDCSPPPVRTAKRPNRRQKRLRRRLLPPQSAEYSALAPSPPRQHAIRRDASESVSARQTPLSARIQEKFSPPRAKHGRKRLISSPLSAPLSSFRAMSGPNQAKTPEILAYFPKLPIVTSVFASTLKHRSAPRKAPSLKKIPHPRRQNCCKPVFPW